MLHFFDKPLMLIPQFACGLNVGVDRFWFGSYGCCQAWSR
jgi:hypothetical protein